MHSPAHNPGVSGTTTAETLQYSYPSDPTSIRNAIGKYINQKYGGPGQGAPGVILDWTARILFNKLELRQSFGVLIFLGDVPEDVSQWRASPNFVGSHVAYVTLAVDNSANCSETAELITEGFVHLNTDIAERSGLSSFEPNVVVPYLKENLHWRVQLDSRNAVDVTRLSSLEVTVQAILLTQQPGEVFPIVGDPQYYHHITHGRPGGARQAQA